MHLSIGSAQLAANHTYDRLASFPYWTLGLSFGGGMVFQAEGCEEAMEGRQITLTAPHAPYHVHRNGSGLLDNYWVIFEPQPQWKRWMHLPPRGGFSKAFMGLPLHDSATTRQVHSAFRDAREVWQSASPQREALAVNAVERIFLLVDTINPLAAHARVDERVRSAMNHMVGHLQDRHTVASLARLAHVSPSHLAHSFREQVGDSPMAWLEAQRIDRACELLVATNDPISHIAEAVGIPNAYYFSTRFRKHKGVSPTAYRKQPG